MLELSQPFQLAGRPEGRNASWVDIWLALAALVPIIIVEVLNDGQNSPAILPFLLIGIIVGAYHRWPLWSLWWLSWALFGIILAILLCLPGPGRPPIVVTLWGLLVLGFLISVGLLIWQQGDGFRAAFAMFPWSLELTHLVLFDDLPAGDIKRFLLMRITAFLIYGGVATLVMRWQSRRIRWLVLIVGALVYLIIAIVVSMPVFAFFVVFPTYLPLLVVLACGSFVIGLSCDSYRARRHLATPICITVLATVILSIIGLLISCFAGNALLVPPHAPLAAQVPGPRRAIIIDTDLSHDDYVAILYLLLRSDVDILGITVANGVTHVETGLENIHRLLAMADREDIPIAAGPPAPLVGDNAFPDLWRIVVGSAFRPALPKPTTAPPSTTASALIRQLVAHSSTPVSFIALGPLTNIAQALQHDPTLASGLDTVVISGGAIYVQDLSNPQGVSDWNLFVDPHAANIVFRSDVPLVLVPLDVIDLHGSSPILLTNSFVDSFTASAGGWESRLMAHIMKGWFLVGPGTEAVPLWDAPVVAIATDPTICTDWRNLSIHITLEPAEVAGRTVVEENGQPNVRACLAGNQAAFEAAYLAVAR
jgi:pyrimidine-specific ribonucleoside hydrolase